MFTSGDEVLRFIESEGVQFVDVRFCDLPGTMQHFTVPAETFDADVFTEGRMFDGSSIRGLPADPRVRHAAAARPDHGGARPVPHAQDAEPDLLRPRPADRRALHPRPAQHRQQGRGLPARQRHRRHRVLRPGGRVLHLRLRALRRRAERGLLPHRLDRGRVEHRPRRAGRQPRLQAGLQGRLLPGAADGPLHRPAVGDGAQADRGRHHCRDAAPRGRHGRPGRDRLQVRHAAQDGRQPDALQVRRQERRPGRRARP